MLLILVILKESHKNVPNATNFLFELGMESGMERQQHIIIGFENYKVKERTHDANTFDIMNGTASYCHSSKLFPTSLNKTFSINTT